uniref:Putative 12-oxophytodienoate reductase 3 n=1 Tax=Anthurium amnicola TaxID=1678845 RepID=A0A1D1XV75_9ARAE
MVSLKNVCQLCKADLPGWPLLSPSKLRLQKCDKCSREFCSPVNYRRHIRVHRRSLHVDKVSPKNKELLGAFWDKLSLDKAKELASFEDVNLEEVAGSSIIGALTSLLQRPGFFSFPQVYLKAGAILLDIAQSRPSRFPISSQELFSVLDDASEKTFLCAGTAMSLQRYMFDGEVGRIALDMKNLVACASFLLEQKLVKAWVADKDAEALRCQKLLFEEEEAAQKRQAELLERKRMKKLRQKEQKTKQHIDVNKCGVKDALCDPTEGTSSLMETETLMEPSEMGLKTSGLIISSTYLSSESTHLNQCMVVDETCYVEVGNPDQSWEYRVQQGGNQRQSTLPHRPNLKPTRNCYGFRPQVSVAKPIAVQRHNGHRDLKSASLINGQKVWTRKHKLEDEEKQTCKEEEKETRDGSDGIAGCEVLIGSISVTLSGRDGETLISVGQKNVQEETAHSTLSCESEPMKLWKQVDREETGVSGSIQTGSKEAIIDGFHSEAADQILQDQSCPANGRISDYGSEMSTNSRTVPDCTESSGPKHFSCKAAQAFLSERWKEAISADHVRLVLSPETETRSMDDDDVCEESQKEVKMQSIDFSCCSILGSMENRIAGMGSIEPSSTIFYTPKFRSKTENGYRLKYIPKQRNIF